MKALIVVDMQNDFMPDGPLPVKDGYRIIPIINHLMTKFKLVIATKDWHPKNHGGFASMHRGKNAGDRIILGGIDQILWPDHCIQNSKGADFAHGINHNKFNDVVEKGMDPVVDSYSAFFDNAHVHATALLSILRGYDVKDLFFVGVATEYCVLFSVLDALDLGFNAHVVTDACGGIGLHQNDIPNALQKMTTHGAKLVTSKEL